MSQNPSGKPILLHPIENQRDQLQSSKNSSNIRSSTQRIDAASSIERFELNHDVATNTPNYAEQMAKAMSNGENVDRLVQILIEETPESYWKTITEQRRRAIEETKAENQQLHDLIDELSKENDQLRVLVNHCDYLQDVLDKLTNDHDSLFDDTNDDETPSDE